VTEDLLARAEEVLRDHWLQSTLLDPQTGDVCLLGAICQAEIEVKAGPAVVPAYQAVEKAIKLVDPGAAGGGFIETISRWNDAAGRQKEDVLRLVALARRLVRWEIEATSLSRPDRGGSGTKHALWPTPCAASARGSRCSARGG
jgi:hypothetical protein